MQNLPGMSVTVVFPPYLVPGRMPVVVLAALHPVNERGRTKERNMFLLNNVEIKFTVTHLVPGHVYV